MPAPATTPRKTRRVDLLDAEQRRRAPTGARPVRVMPRLMDSHESIPSHTHPWHQVTIALQGACRVSTPDSSWVLPPSRAILLPAGMPHSIETLDRTVLRAVYLHRDALPHTTECRAMLVSRLLHELVAALADAADAPASEREQLLGALVLDELQRAAPQSLHLPLPRDRRMLALAQAVLQDPGDTADAATWGTRIGASERTIARMFRAETGMSFAQWRAQARLAQALTHLAQGKSVATVAAAAGYDSASAFTAMFRKAFGAAPRDLRAQAA